MNNCLFDILCFPLNVSFAAWRGKLTQRKHTNLIAGKLLLGFSSVKFIALRQSSFTMLSSRTRSCHRQKEIRHFLMVHWFIYFDLIGFYVLLYYLYPHVLGDESNAWVTQRIFSSQQINLTFVSEGWWINAIRCHATFSKKHTTEGNTPRDIFEVLLFLKKKQDWRAGALYKHNLYV